MEEPGLDNRHRDKNGEISKKHGNTLISTLRQTYGQAFAPGQPGHKKLSEILHELDIEFAEPARQRPAAAPVCVTKPPLFGRSRTFLPTKQNRPPRPLLTQINAISPLMSEYFFSSGAG